MKTGFALVLYLVVLPFTLAFLPATALAQQTPVTGQMMGPGGVPAAASAPAVAAPPPSAAMSTPSGSHAPALPPGQQAMTTRPAPAYVASSDTAPAVMPPPAHVTVMGETTRSLLQMQADGTQAGKHLPMLGAEASASYDRYMKSFSHDIPEFYKTNVGKDSNGTAGGE